MENLIFDRRAAALDKRVANAKRTRLRTQAGHGAIFFTPAAVARIRELEREEPTELAYTLTALAVALGVSPAAILASVRRGRIPPADRVVGGQPRWLPSTIDPVLVRLGKMTLDEKLRADAKQAMRDAMNWRGRRRVAGER